MGPQLRKPIRYLIRDKSHFWNEWWESLLNIDIILELWNCISRNLQSQYNSVFIYCKSSITWMIASKMVQNRIGGRIVLFGMTAGYFNYDDLSAKNTLTFTLELLEKISVDSTIRKWVMIQYRNLCKWRSPNYFLFGPLKTSHIPYLRHLSATYTKFK